MKLLLLTEAYSRNSAIESAVKNRRRIIFYYAGPRSGKDSVKAGRRFEVEPVAVGLTKKGNMAIRGWVNNRASVTKTGFEKGQWRTFLVTRMHQLNITDEVFDEKRPGYKEGDDGSFSVTYATSDWEKRPYKRKFEPELSRRKQAAKDAELAKQKEPEMGVQPTEPTDLPMPKAMEKPDVEPDKELGADPPPPTPEIPREIPPEPENQELEPEVAGDDEEENLELQESINRIKALMLY